MHRATTQRTVASFLRSFGRSLANVSFSCFIQSAPTNLCVSFATCLHSCDKWPHGVRQELPSAVRQMESCVSIPLAVWMAVCSCSLIPIHGVLPTVKMNTKLTEAVMAQQRDEKPLRNECQALQTNMIVTYRGIRILQAIRSHIHGDNINLKHRPTFNTMKFLALNSGILHGYKALIKPCTKKFVCHLKGSLCRVPVLM